MIVGIDSSKKNLGSSQKLFEYLDKENNGKIDAEKDLLFDQSRDDISPEEATKAIDSNVAKLGKKEEKYFSLHISPSSEEIKAIGGDTDKMKDFVRSTMDEYAKNFNKGLDGKDLVYFAKVERTREFKNSDLEVQSGIQKQKVKKQGDQLHVHVVVSRKDQSNTIRLSPKDNSKGGTNFQVPTVGKTISRGFDRNKFFNKVEELFDKKFDYVRAPEESFEYRRLQQHHPKEFKERFGAEGKNVIRQDLNHPYYKREFVETHISEAVKKNSEKDTVDSYLSQRGISVNKKGVDLNGQQIPFSKLILSKDTLGKIEKIYFKGANEKSNQSPLTKYRKPTQAQKNQIEVHHVKNEFSKTEYTEIHVNKILTKGQLKRQADTYLKEKGIILTPKGAKVNGTTTDYGSFNFTKEAGELLQAFYLTKKLGRNLEGKDEDKDQER